MENAGLGDALIAGSSKAARSWQLSGLEPLPAPRHQHMRLGCCGHQHLRTCPYLHTLKYELANSYYWSGSFWKDYWYFVMNWHPFFSVFFCHPDHPWTKCQRFCMLLISISITELPLLFMAIFHVNLPPLDEKLVIFEFVTMPNILIGIVLYQCAIGGTRLPCCSKLFKCLTWFIIVFCLWNVAGMGAMIMGLGEKGQEELEMHRFFRSLFQSQLQYYATWFPIWFLMPCKLGFYSGWSASRQRAELHPDFAPTSDELANMPWAP
eukprot:TRINITY_DN71168_c0_g1_i2.p1 TRINITY_DN71168_c0_g1~~TRINITY_DN71168_c0_g1_i2.p1  ORF type:complete len:265 (+),score=8.19 TRINITY_DN71168_c0_g1_i2:62-856(+)